MRIGLQTWGSEGDIRPFLALAGKLQASGHEVTLVVTSIYHKDYSQIAENLDINIQYVATPVINDKYQLERIGRSIIKETNPLKKAIMIIDELFIPVLDEMYSAAKALCESNELVIGHFFHYPLNIAARKMRTPAIILIYVHQIIPSRYVPPAGIPNLGKWINPLLWAIMKSILNKYLLPYVNKLCQREGLPVFKDFVTDVWTSNKLTLISVSPVFCKQQKDWGAHYQVCGFFDLPEKALNWEIPDDLKKFLEEGSPPVYMSFGSLMPISKDERHKTFELFREAAQLANCRTIIQVDKSDMVNLTSTQSIHYLPPVPHKKIFPYCAAIVHHGGSGTTQTATLAGVPSIVVAHISDQRFWGLELKRLGLAPALLNRRTLNANKLSKRIRAVLDSPDMRKKAQEFAKSLKQEDGVAKAVEMINRFIESKQVA